MSIVSSHAPGLCPKGVPFVAPHTARLHRGAGSGLPIVVKRFPYSFSAQPASFGRCTGGILPFMQAQEARQPDDAEMAESVCCAQGCRKKQDYYQSNREMPSKTVFRTLPCLFCLVCFALIRS